jgi:parallel beta-helix repeat protein
MITCAFFARAVVSFVLVAALRCPLSIALAQGSLVPDGVPGPTFKTLSQIEPRTPISSATNITESGSYYFTTNVLAGLNEIGLTIAANDVTVDLNGFTLSSSGGGVHGILVLGAQTNLTIKNGTLRNWSGPSISAGACENGRYERLRFQKSGDFGIWSGPNSQISECILRGGTNGTGVLAAYGSRVRDCTVQGYAVGIVAGYGSVVSGCTVNESSGTGINVGSRSCVVQCAVTGPGSNGIVATVSSVTSCSVGELDGVGINIGDLGSAVDCVVWFTKGNGIQASVGNVIRRNTISNIGVNTNAAAIHVTGSRNRIEGNHVTFGNGPGVRVTSGNNVIIQNVVQNNADNYSQIVGGNQVGPVGDPATATSPWANF